MAAEKLQVGDKVRARPYGIKVRKVTEVTEDGEWFKWGGSSSWRKTSRYEIVPSDTPVDHSTG